MYVLKKFFSPWAEPGVLRVEAEELCGSGRRRLPRSAPRTKALGQGINSVIRHPFVLIALSLITNLIPPRQPFSSAEHVNPSVPPPDTPGRQVCHTNPFGLFQHQELSMELLQTLFQELIDEVHPERT